jgi:hypothetical protein
VVAHTSCTVLHAELLCEMGEMTVHRSAQTLLPANLLVDVYERASGIAALGQTNHG